MDPFSVFGGIPSGFDPNVLPGLAPGMMPPAAGPDPFEPVPPPPGEQTAEGTEGTVTKKKVEGPMDERTIEQQRQQRLQQGSNGIVNALRGASTPPKPDVVKPSTPGLPATQRIEQGALFNMLNSVSNPRMQPPRFTTLGGALGTGRY